jgi:uncharacterized protein (DUF736 family)
LDPNHLDNRLEHGRTQIGTGWETNANDGTTWANVL